MLSIQSLSKQYGAQWAVRQVSFEARPGEVLGFLGPNGAGKSTTMKIATGYLPATEGKVLVNGIDVAAEPLRTKAAIGYLPEHNPLYLDMYVPEYLAFSGRSYGLAGQALAASVARSIERTGLGPERGKKIGALSKGYRQRVGLAQTLVHDPPVLILDEPTTGLDPNQILEIRALIREVGREKTVVLSTHILQEVQAICQRYVIIHRGQIAAEGVTTAAGPAQAGPSQYLLELDRPLPPADLAALEGVLTAMAQPGQPAAYLLQLSDDRLGRQAVLRLAAERDLDVRRLARQEQDLEAIFREATQ